MTALIRDTMRTRVESEISGNRRCITGEVCLMNYFPQAGIKKDPVKI